MRRREIIVGDHTIECEITTLAGPPRWEVTVYRRNDINRAVVDYHIEPTFGSALKRVGEIAGPLAAEAFRH